MSTPERPAADETDLATLVRRLAEAEAALQAALAGQVDAIVDAEGHPLLLHDAQRTLISSEATQRRAAEMQAAILNALPAHIALVDTTGTILAVNESWRLFASANGMQQAAFGVGQNYLAVCESASGDCADEAPNAARGLRRVLAGEAKAFSLEYPCHSPTEQRWFRLMITPVVSDRLTGAVVMHVDVTERRIAENALRASEASMAAAQRIAHFGSWELDLANAADPDANALRWSDEMFRIAGFEPGAVPVTNALFFSLVPPEEHAAIRAAVATALRERRSYSVVHRLVRPDGTERVVQETAQIFFEENTGRPLRMVGTAHDITEQRHAQEAIRRQAHMLDHIGQAVIATDAAGRIIYTNRHAAELYGWSAEEMLGRDIVAVTVPDVSREQAAAILARLRGGGTWSGEFDVRDRAGRVFPALVTDAPLLDADGRLIGIVGVSTDISARKEAEEAARRSAEEQRVLAAQLADERARLVEAQAVANVGSWETDFATLDVVWSEQTYRIFEADPATFRPTHAAFLELVHPDDRRAIDAALLRSVNQTGTHTVEHRLLLPDGRIKFVEERWRVVAGAAGGPRRAVGTCQDISERKRTEERLRHSQKLLSMAGRLSRMGAWSVTVPEFGITWSDELCAIHEVPPGYTPSIAEAVDFYAPECRETISRVFGACVQDGTPFDVELEIVTAKHRRVWVRAIGEAVRNAEGGITHVQGATQDISDRKAAEAATRELAERLTATLESLTDAFYTVDRAWRFTYLNAAAERMFRQPRAEMLGQDLWEKFPDVRGTVAQRDYERALRDNVPVQFELFYPPLGVWLDVRAFPSAQGLAVYLRDVTAARQADAALRASEERFAAFMANVPLAAWIVSDDTVVYANSGFARLFGRPPADVIGKTLADLFGAELAAEYAANNRHILAHGQPEELIERAPRADGTLGRYLSYKFPIPAQFGRGLVGGTALDITEREAARLALESSEERLRLLAKATNDAVWDWDLATDTLWWNEGYEKLFGYRRAETDPGSQSWTAPIHPDDSARVLDGIRRVIAQGREWSDEYRFRCQNGTHAYVINRGYVLRDAAGKAVRMIGGMTDLTERKEIEENIRKHAEQLRVSEEKYRLLFTDNPLPMWVFDPDTFRFLAVNAATVRHYGYGEAELLAGDIFLIRPPEDVPEVRAYLQETRHTGRDISRRRHRKKDGTIIEVEVMSDRIDFADRGARLVLINDITERVRAEREAALANRALHMLNRGNEALVRARDEAALLAEICRIVVEVGGFRFAWVGYAEPDGGKRVSPQAHAGHEAGYLKEIAVSWAESAPTGRGPIARAIRSGRAVAVPDVAAAEAGFVSLEAAAARGYRGIVCLPLADQGRAFGVLALYLAEIRTLPADELNLLERLADNLAFGILARRARAQQREQAALIDESHDAIMVRDLDHRIVFWSKGAERLYGWSAAEAAGQSSFALLKTDPVQFREADAAVRAHGIWNGEIRKVTRDGTVLTIDARWTLLRDAQEQPRSILTFDTDITERKKLEQQFLRAQRMESIGTLAGGIAHDLNNVLAPIVMGVDLLREFTADEPSLQILQNIERSARRGSDLVKQVLSFARGVEGARVAVFLGHIVREVESIAHNSFPKNIALESAVPKDLWLVTGDPTQLNQVLLNLCVNARDAMPDGGKIAITARNTTVDAQYATLNRGVASGRYVCIEVADTGCGMPKAVVERIFEPFFTTKELGKGTGLGLSTVLGIVRSHGGFVNVYSEVGHGSVFKVYLPAQTEGTAADAPGTADAAALPRGHGELILVVDDEASVRDITRQTLEAFGYRVVTAEDGAQAIGLYALHRGSVGVVLTDMMMPVMDGPALIAALKRIDPALRIVAASGLNANGNVAKAANIGVKHFLAKPYTVEALLTTIRTVLTETLP